MSSSEIRFLDLSILRQWNRPPSWIKGLLIAVSRHRSYDSPKPHKSMLPLRFCLPIPFFLLCFSLGLNVLSADQAAVQKIQAPILIDMVHNNPGEHPFETHFNDPFLIKQLGYTGKVYELFESAQFGIDWASVDPDIFPAGSTERAWVEAKGMELDKLYSSTKAAGLNVYCHTDMVVLPKKLVEKYNLSSSLGDVSNPETQKFLRLAIRQMFQRFPQLDGLVVRIGETYLQGAPYHQGGMKDKADPEKTIAPLMNLLREEVCVNLNKKVFFRSWMSFDTDSKKYLRVSDGVEPHPNLAVVVKHCEGDFHRGNPFSKVLGIGRHSQLVEVQCQREYEGKGAYPNYIAHGVIEGFEEHQGQSLRKLWSSNPLIIGMSTWSRGGGWEGPYLSNELWCDLNVYVLAKWTVTPSRTEEEIFGEYCSKVLKLNAADAAKFRRLCFLSADAIYRGKRSTQNDIDGWWTRDEYIARPPLPKDAAKRQRILEEKDASVRMWSEIVTLAKEIQFPDHTIKEYVVTSSEYGLDLFRIYRAGFQLAALESPIDKAKAADLISEYDQAWSDLRKLKEDHPSCATLYTDEARRQYTKEGIGDLVKEIKRQL